jgi:hypothetical protein
MLWLRVEQVDIGVREKAVVWSLKVFDWDTQYSKVLGR